MALLFILLKGEWAMLNPNTIDNESIAPPESDSHCHMRRTQTLHAVQDSWNVTIHGVRVPYA